MHDRVICTHRRDMIPRSALHPDSRWTLTHSNFQKTTTQATKISAEVDRSCNDQLPNRKALNAIFFFNPPHLKIARSQSEEEREQAMAVVLARCEI